jgi:hypothetical protein
MAKTEADTNCGIQLQRLIVGIEKNRLQIQMAWEKAECLDAAIASSTETRNKIKARRFSPRRRL